MILNYYLKIMPVNVKTIDKIDLLREIFTVKSDNKPHPPYLFTIYPNLRLFKGTDVLLVAIKRNDAHKASY